MAAGLSATRMLRGTRDARHRYGASPQSGWYAQRMPVGQHLARQRLADLFLGTLPYNTDTTASDAVAGADLHK